MRQHPDFRTESSEVAKSDTHLVQVTEDASEPNVATDKVSKVPIDELLIEDESVLDSSVGVSSHPGLGPNDLSQSILTGTTDSLINKDAPTEFVSGFSSHPGLVRDGLPVTVKITAYDFVRYGGLDGTVSHLAPDTSEESGEPYYRLVITTEKGYLGSDPSQNQITPGMGAVVDIRVGVQSVLDFLLRPVLKMTGEAFREP